MAIPAPDMREIQIERVGDGQMGLLCTVLGHRVAWKMWSPDFCSGFKATLVADHLVRAVRHGSNILMVGCDVQTLIAWPDEWSVPSDPRVVDVPAAAVERVFGAQDLPDHLRVPVMFPASGRSS